MSVTRRETLARFAALGAATLVPARLVRAAAGWRSAVDPFTLGVASGFPTDRSVVLWTRLAPEPLVGGAGMPTDDVEVAWEIAEDEGFRRIARRGNARAEAAFAHSARVEVSGLSPARDYWYRFTAGGQRSPAGRTRTLPRDGAPLASLSLAVVNCQHYEQGHYAGYRHVAASAPDLILHLGDYIYEGPGTAGALRIHQGGLCRTLEEYRARYTQYHLDQLLQAAHAAAPWMHTWDDHEVANDYSGIFTSRAEDPQVFLARRTAAYRACYENLPLPPSAAPRGIELPIFARRSLGDLATIHMLDQRQYRSAQACPLPGRAGGNRLDESCTDREAPERTMLGADQERWFSDGLARTRGRWTLLAQGTLVSHLDEKTGEGRVYGSDSWNGYPAARTRLLGALQSQRTANPVVLSGDLHAWVVGGINTVPERPDTPILAAEFCVTSLTSNPRPQPQLDEWKAENPNLLLADGTSRGYLALQLTPGRLTAKLMTTENVRDPSSAVRELRAFTVESGSPQIHPA